MTAAAASAASRPGRGATPGWKDWKSGRQPARELRWPQAVRAFSRATRAAPGDAVFWLNLANAHHRSGAVEQAEGAARRCLALDPMQPVARRLLGESLAQQHRYAEAVKVLSALEAAGQSDVESLTRYGGVLQSLLRFAESSEVLLRALALKPDHVPAYALLADSLRDRGLKREATECLRTVLALQPGNLEALIRLSFEKRHTLDWSDLDSDVQRISELLQAQGGVVPRVLATFATLSLPLAPELQLLAARGEAAALAAGVKPLPVLDPAARRAGRSRLGWLSYDFRDHAVSQLLVEVIETLDRSRFELTLYSSGPDDGTELRRRMVAACDHFVDLRGLSDAQAAERVRADGIDLLVDLMGHTRGQRMGILARRPAAVQASFLGYPGSTGADCMDYLVGDPLVTPLALAPLYSEKLAQLPLCFQPNNRSRPRPQPMARAEAGLPDEAFVICAFNHTYKILPAAFERWCAVLRRVAHAVLWLKQTNAQLHDNVRREAAARGVDPARVLFAPTVSYAQHFSRLALADVFADTWPYNAHTTASDALWAGVPVVTVYGNNYASRVAASVLNAVGLGELAFEQPEDYENALVALATEPGLCAAYRAHLQSPSQGTPLPLFDTPRYTAELAALFERMVQRWQQGLAPAHLPAQHSVDLAADVSAPAQAS